MMQKRHISIRDLNKLVSFNLLQLVSSWLFWLFLLLTFLSQPLIILPIHLMQKSNIIIYSLLIILIPLILGVIQILVFISVLFQDNKSNSIEYKLICSKYSKLNINISRMLTVLITLLFTTIFHDLFLLLLFLSNMVKVGLALFISNTFITPFIYIFFISLFTIIALKTPKITFLLLSFVIIIFTLGISLIMRPLFILKRNSPFDYNSNNLNPYSYVQLINKNNKNVIMVNKKESFNLNIYNPSEYVFNFINRQGQILNFAPSEWLMSFYSSLFVNFNFDLDFNFSAFNLMTIKVSEINYLNSSEDYINYVAIRPGDTDFIKLNNEEYEELILDNIGKIVKKYNMVNNPLTCNLIINNLNLYQNWNEMKSSQNLTINFLKDTTGVNTEFNQLFYLIKYKDLILEKIPNLFLRLEEIYNKQISNIFNTVLTGSITNFNLFDPLQNSSSYGILKTGKKIDYFYPMVLTKMKNDLPSETDINFIKNDLIKFIELNGSNQISYLNNQSLYSLNDNDLEKFNTLFPLVSDYQSWTDYIMSLKTFNDFETMLTKLKNLFPDIYDYKLSDNSLDDFDSVVMLNPSFGNTTLVWPIFILFYSLLTALIIFIIFKQSSLKKKRELKNEK